MLIGIVNYKMGNLSSVQNMLNRVGVSSIISSNPEELNQCTHLILPGVGAFDEAMKNIKELHLLEWLKQKAQIDKVPFLGICLGMQLLTQHSEEGNVEGLGFFDADVKRFSFQGDSDLKIPHMGWNIVQPSDNSILFKNMPSDEIRFYFVHSYYVTCHTKEDIAAKTVYGYPFTCAIQHENIMGVQFHPEKSHKFGMQLLKNFVAYAG